MEKIIFQHKTTSELCIFEICGDIKGKYDRNDLRIKSELFEYLGGEFWSAGLRSLNFFTYFDNLIRTWSSRVCPIVLISSQLETI